MEVSLLEAVIARCHRVPLPERMPGDGVVVARQLDAALMSAGFKCSQELFADLAGREAGQVMEIGAAVVRAVRRIAGDHVQHNPYFRDFPFNVPATLEFWAEMLQQALTGPDAARVEALSVRTAGGQDVLVVNLLSLPGYGRVQHAYEDMLTAHGALIAAAGDRLTIVHAGDNLREETGRLYLELAGSAVPLSEEDLPLLERLAYECVAGPHPERVPVRENRAILNKAALASGCPLLADTVTDVLRLAAAVSGGDVTLQERTRFRSFRRPERRIIMACLDRVVAGNPAKLGDVPQYAEQWKRLGERLHPHEHGGYPQAQRVFAVARGEEQVRSFASRVELSFRAGGPEQAARLLSLSPGTLVRSLDRLLRATASPSQVGEVLRRAERAAPDVACRVLLSVREHFHNRGHHDGAGLPRIFANRKGRAWVTPDSRPGIDPAVRGDVLAMLDAAITARLPEPGRLIVDPAVLGVALPLSAKPAAPGMGVMPRGSVSAVIPSAQDVLSFFIYWRQSKRRTDYDLSALMVSHDFTRSDFVSWQGYHSTDGAVTYSGDITSAPDGATEFISVQLDRMSLPIIIPQVHIYSGEGFGEAAEAFFGYMLRGSSQRGAPFEAATVRMKSDLRGNGRVALPLAFIRGEDGHWRAKWLHFYLRGRPSMNVVQDHKPTTGLLTRTVTERDYLQIRYLAGLLSSKTEQTGDIRQAATPDELASHLEGHDGPVSYIGLEHPEGLPASANVTTLQNLAALIPE